MIKELRQYNETNISTNKNELVDHPCAKEKYLTYIYFTVSIKSNSKWIRDLNVKCKTMKKILKKIRKCKDFGCD